MPLYTYSNWKTRGTDAATRLLYLREYMSEVLALIGPATSGADHSQSSRELKDLYQGLVVEEEKLEAAIAAASTPRFQRIRLRRN